ncbi:alpha-1,4-glucan:alpha-1,4-glucan 6-glycosyltransferase [Desulfocapsa sulfexigens DSM 10523]|uniref:1,4-alpha-glucan branching enzyme GlgB n=1 Tax=Desulfocapsa sulfexigens (strain DSM 10523 / SB164P1) TaxID=1167006 RepID=M1PDN9_DESSD|nr:1,4-alpha-glucan branching protein GlgB [Desulfocapsa sulfexigens]AGF79707.1 alpha-1,4-glucan:alpha-1,4-glucan 6-glycosyltransferase [Desulfocapsa sulfexigens DSM 10523]
MGIKEQIDRLLLAEHYDPFQVLGVHFSDNDKDSAVIRCFQPHARSVSLLIDGKTIPMERVRSEGIFEATIDRGTVTDENLDPYTYQYKITYNDGVEKTINDPYRFMPILSEEDRFLFNFGTNYELYDHIGAHPGMYSQIRGTIFRVWAPSATRVSVLGNFNGWDGRVHPMRSLGSSGIWELFLPGIGEDEIYKFEIRTTRGDILEKSDPFQFFGEHRPKTASVVRYLDHYQWHDRDWQQSKKEANPYENAMTIYELHPGSWQRDPSNPERFLTFRELADRLIPYVKKLGFTHIELMPVMEHPLDESWGYQITGPFSMTSRYGVPEDFMHFVDSCHLEGLGVILDWVPAHFPKDSHSLARFDGTALFEHEDPRKGAHPEWGTFIYNYGRKEVSNFLIANALFWIDKYHIDGLRVDAVASMLYLDYSRKEGEWLPNQHGGRENLEAIEFIKHLNSVVYERHPGTLMIAEESTSFYGVSKPADQGGLGFGFKWNMGWMNDILAYFEKDCFYRRFHHNSLTFSIMYAFSENFILPLSHDEVVHGKRSLIDKMPGDLWQKFANLRLLYLTMWMHPGKKLLFMGGEFGQWREWNCKQSLDFHLLHENDHHKAMLHFFHELNTLYKSNASLWELDFSPDGFQWMDLEDRENSIISYARFAKNRDDHLVCLLNFTPQTFYNYKIGLPSGSNYEQVFCSDQSRFGGSNAADRTIYRTIDEPYAQAQFHANVTVPPLAGIVLKPC